MESTRAVFIDIDNTIVKGTTIISLASSFLERGDVNKAFLARIAFYYALYKFNILKDFKKVIRKSSSTTERISEKIGNEVASKCLQDKIIPRIFPEAITLLNDFNKKGYQIYYVSSTLEIIADRLKDHIGFGEVIASKIEVKDGYFTGLPVGNICYGKEKLVRINEIIKNKNINLEESYALSDHISDIPMLEKVGHPIVVNGSKRFVKYAQKNNWDIKRFSL
jgi:HAD superfamily hydrolase (TIGR01490 family)